MVDGPVKRVSFPPPAPMELPGGFLGKDGKLAEPMPSAFYKIEKLTYSERFWRRLGFRERHAMKPEPTPETAAFDFDTTHTVATFWVADWKDRLRVLISGRLLCHQVVVADAKVTKLTNTAVVSVLPPGAMPSNFKRPALRDIISREDIRKAAEGFRAQPK